jgi:2-polyprenyl-3-methyl-5-hydroxy-6-metoxy-1,4-benzoquinol methylase
MNKKVSKNQYGFFELEEKPTAEYVKKYFEKTYFQNNCSKTYAQAYSKEEITWIKNNLKMARQMINSVKDIGIGGHKFLDVGCGEGWALQYFHEQGWDVSGIDVSSFGIENHNPAMLNYFQKGDVYESLERFEGQKYDVVWLSNVLQLVLDPVLLLKMIVKVMSPNGILFIQVSNNFSKIQQKLLEENYIDDDFWVVPLDHFSYFNKEGLDNLCASVGLKNELTISDFPIDFNLFNPDTNYVNDKSKGRNVHLARVAIENLFAEISISKTINLYKALVEMGLGRSIVSVFSVFPVE